MLDTSGIWTPLNSANTEIQPEWCKKASESQIASGMPLLCGYSAGGTNRFTAALSEIRSNTYLGAGVVEENCNCEFAIKLFRTPVEPIEEYSFTLRLDFRQIPYYNAIMDVKNWWENEIGAIPCPVPESATHPVYSTWYNFHQNISAEELLNELKVAKSLGFDTIIVDDGWQCDDNNRGYTYAGDWIPAHSKIGDPKHFTDECHKLGIKVIFWYSVPFIGYEAYNFKRFSDKYLSMDDGMKCAVLDPRFRDVREFLTTLYIQAVTNYGLDGLKLDFIDKFELTSGSSTNYAAMDIPILEDAVFTLMSEIHQKLTAISPEIMIEFRQKYVGPAICAFGNMLRVSDCPYSGMTNARGIIDLRLTSGQTVVHTDMSMWHCNTSNEDVARQLFLGLFAVPQISVMLNKLLSQHKEVIKIFLDYWNNNKSLLLNGDFSCSTPSNTYSFAKVSGKNKDIVLLITKNVAQVNSKNTDILNATGEDHIYLDLTHKTNFCTLIVTNSLGRTHFATNITEPNILKIDAPTGSYISVMFNTQKD